MKTLHMSKTAGYGTEQDAWANFRTSQDWGVPAYIGCLVRMGDKYTRLTNLIKNPQNDQVGESITDTAQDLASYALIFICLYNEYVYRELNFDVMGGRGSYRGNHNPIGNPDAAA